jgi:hypothetical protein
MVSRTEIARKKLWERHNMTVSQSVLMQLLAVFFAIMPTRVFIAVSSDVLQLGVVVTPFAIAFMVLLISIDPTFGLFIPKGAVENLSNRYQKFSGQLSDILYFSLALVVVTLIVKSLAVWFIGRGWLAVIVNHFGAWTVGALVATLLIKISGVRDIFGYLLVGAELGLRQRAGKLRD